MLPQGHPNGSREHKRLHAPSGLKRPPLRGELFHIPAHHPRRACGSSRWSSPCLAAAAVAGLRFPAFGRPRLMPLPSSLRSLTLVAGGIPPRVAGRSPPRLTLAYASGIPPALQKVSTPFLSCVLFLVLMRHSLSHCALRQLASLLKPDGFSASH
jgi:hypothetical protein